MYMGYGPIKREALWSLYLRRILHWSISGVVTVFIETTTRPIMILYLLLPFPFLCYFFAFLCFPLLCYCLMFLVNFIFFSHWALIWLLHSIPLAVLSFLPFLLLSFLHIFSAYFGDRWLLDVRGCMCLSLDHDWLRSRGRNFTCDDQSIHRNIAQCATNIE